MVIFDTNVLVLFFAKRLSPIDQARITGLLRDLRRKKEPVGIPAQVWAEFLDEASPEEIAASHSLFKGSSFRLLNYDLRSAVETVEVARSGRAVRKSSKDEKRPRQAVKVDWQIIAMARVYSARFILTNDGPMSLESERAGLKCLTIAALELPDDLRQGSLELVAYNEQPTLGA